MESSMDRVIALKLYSLHEDDRAWLLSQIDPLANKRLIQLLSELEELKFKVDSALVNAVNTTAHRAKQVLSEEVRRIDSTSFRQIETIFDNEPKFLLSCLAMQYEWKWLSDFKKSTRTATQGTTASINQLSDITANAKEALFTAVAKRVKPEASSLGIELTHLKLTQALQSRLAKVRNKVLPWKR